MEKNNLLVLHRGVSFYDVCLINPQGETLYESRWIYSKHRFRSQIESFLSSYSTSLKAVVLLDEFADRLSGLRLGGSVAAVFPKGLEKLTAQLQTSPIHSESVILVAPDSWGQEWMDEALQSLKQHSIKRIAWQVEAPGEVVEFFQAQGFENFITEPLHPHPLLNWRRNLLNASCSGPILEITEELQSTLKNLEVEVPIYWMDEDLQAKTQVANRYGLTSVWTHLVGKWAQKKMGQKTDVFVLDWDGCFHIGQPTSLRWTPWGPVSSLASLPSVQLLSIQPTQTLEKNLFGNWDWRGRADNFEPGPIFLGRGLKPTVLDIILPPDLISTQFETKTDFSEKLNRQISALMGLKHTEEIEREKAKLKRSAIQQWALEILQLAESNCWLLLGPLAEAVQTEFKTLQNYKIQCSQRLPSLGELYPWESLKL